MRTLRGHLRANLVAYVALFFALGLGSAWAATELERNAVTSKHVKNRGVKTKDLATNSVRSVKVANGTLLAEDFAVGQLPAGEPGAQGEPGPEGPQGVPGERGPAGATEVMLRSSQAGHASCPPDQQMTGGGARANGDDVLRWSYPDSVDASGAPIAWSAGAIDPPGTAGDGVNSGATAFVICASP